MLVKQIIVVKETRDGEGRVALTPNAVASLVEKNYSIMIESEAGLKAGFSNEDYLKAGGKLFELKTTYLPKNSLILRVKRPNKNRESLENKLIPIGSIMMGFLDPFDVSHENHISNWQSLGITTISLELLHLKANDPRNAQAAMSRFAGRLALKDALARYQGKLPKRVSILGTGPAGLGAVYAACELQLPVQLFGRQERYRNEIEKQGIHYIVLPEKEQPAFIAQRLSHETLIIAAVRNIGEKPPILINEESLLAIPDKAVIIDLCTGEGGAVIGSQEDAVITRNRGISIINASGYPKAEPKAASEAFAKCMVNLLFDIVPAQGELDFKNEILREAVHYSTQKNQIEY